MSAKRRSSRHTKVDRMKSAVSRAEQVPSWGEKPLSKYWQSLPWWKIPREIFWDCPSRHKSFRSQNLKTMTSIWVLSSDQSWWKDRFDVHIFSGGDAIAWPLGEACVNEVSMLPYFSPSEVQCWKEGPKNILADSVLELIYVNSARILDTPSTPHHCHSFRNHGVVDVDVF